MRGRAEGKGISKGANEMVFRGFEGAPFLFILGKGSGGSVRISFLSSLLKKDLIPNRFHFFTNLLLAFY